MHPHVLGGLGLCPTFDRNILAESGMLYLWPWHSKQSLSTSLRTLPVIVHGSPRFCILRSSILHSPKPGVHRPAPPGSRCPVWWRARDRHCLRTVPLGGGRGGGDWGGGDTAAVVPGLKLCTPFFLLVLMWTIHMSGNYHLISQAGWNRCNLLYSTLLYSCLLLLFRCIAGAPTAAEEKELDTLPCLPCLSPLGHLVAVILSSPFKPLHLCGQYSCMGATI